MQIFNQIYIRNGPADLPDPKCVVFQDRIRFPLGVGVGMLRGVGDSFTCKLKQSNFRNLQNSKMSSLKMSNFKCSNFKNNKVQASTNKQIETSTCRKLKFANVQFSNTQTQNFHNINIKNLVHEPSTIFIISDSQIWKYSYSRMFPYLFLCFLNYFCDKYGVPGSSFGHIIGRSKNVPKSIAIDQRSLLRRLGIIKTPPKKQ